MSRFDYADPGTDQKYCDGISADEPRECPDCGDVVHADGSCGCDLNVCAWCKQPLSGNCEIRDDHYPYCSAICSLRAENDD